MGRRAADVTTTETSHGDTGAEGPAHLAVERMSKRFGGDGPWAVRDLSLHVRPGEFFGLMGPSGCGKSTTLGVIAGFVEPDTGDVLLDGRSLVNVPPHRRRLAMVFQDYALFPHLDAGDNVAFGPRLRRTPAGEVARKVEELLRLVDLEHKGHRLPAQLSGGEQQRVAVARALAVDPEVVLLDEPLSNLDARLRQQMRRDLKDVLDRTGVTALFVTHDQAEAFAVCHRVAVMFDGIIQQVGAPLELYRDPRTRAVADFIGEGNFLDAIVTKSNGATSEVDVLIGSETVRSGTRPGEPTSIGTRGVVLMRPEALTLDATSDATSPDGDASTGLTGRIVRQEFLGFTVQYDVEAGGVVLQAAAFSNRPTLAPGTTVKVSWAPDDVVFFAGDASAPPPPDPALER